MNIMQTYNLYKEIKSTKNVANLYPRYFSERYTLQTNNYDMVAEEKFPNYDEETSAYTFLAQDKTSDKAILIEGFVAAVLFWQIRNKSKHR